MNSRILSTLLLALTGLQVACGPRGGSTQVGQHDISIEARALPKNFRDQSVNKGTAKINALALELSTAAGANTGGGFNGPGVGNRAIVGLTSFDGKPLSSLHRMSLEISEASEPVQLLLLVDLNCDNQVRVLEASANTGTTDVSLDQPIWRSTGQPITNEDGEIIVDDETPSNLTVLLANFPHACLRNTNSRDASLPKIPTAAVLLALGSNHSVKADRAVIQRITIGETTFDRSTWESK